MGWMEHLVKAEKASAAALCPATAQPRVDIAKVKTLWWKNNHSEVLPWRTAPRYMNILFVYVIHSFLFTVIKQKQTNGKSEDLQFYCKISYKKRKTNLCLQYLSSKLDLSNMSSL